ncbi:uncharacterized protein LOC111455861 isoform X2 [Cucurbita moschata]|uniref:Uncharacterized protein LOC111455861 isoform X2 n=1 Tax=Cucurbita moschata TaxID=3662 RepID=A0A6J1GP49_CUCMO|nr:uncharacterized protein LOC111455861 isoform X2 [Cucurbita moschata]
MASFGSLKNAIFEREERKQQYQAHVRGLNAHDRRKKFMHAQRSFITRERKKMRNSEGWSKKCPKGRGTTPNFKERRLQHHQGIIKLMTKTTLMNMGLKATLPASTGSIFRYLLP